MTQDNLSPRPFQGRDDRSIQLNRPRRWQLSEIVVVTHKRDELPKEQEHTGGHARRSFSEQTYHSSYLSVVEIALLASNSRAASPAYCGSD
jgi:hypothetical protein